MIDVNFQHSGSALQESWIQEIVRTVLEGESSRFEGSLSVVITDDQYIQKLNEQFFGRDRPTDVIAFPLDDSGDDLWGELYVSIDRAEAQAAEYHVSVPEETARLLVHGVLHLHGYDDLDRSSKERMSGREDHYLAFFKSNGLL